jgi:antitoxin YefM
MAIITTYAKARQTLAELCDRAADDRETVIIQRREKGDVALVSADELNSLVETAYLLRSPKNAKRLLTALNRAEQRALASTSVRDLRRQFLPDE